MDFDFITISYHTISGHRPQWTTPPPPLNSRQHYLSEPPSVCVRAYLPTNRPDRPTDPIIANVPNVHIYIYIISKTPLHIQGFYLIAIALPTIIIAWTAVGAEANRCCAGVRRAAGARQALCNTRRDVPVWNAFVALVIMAPQQAPC